MLCAGRGGKERLAESWGELEAGAGKEGIQASHLEAVGVAWGEGRSEP